MTACAAARSQFQRYRRQGRGRACESACGQLHADQCVCVSSAWRTFCFTSVGRFRWVRTSNGHHAAAVALCLAQLNLGTNCIIGAAGAAELAKALAVNRTLTTVGLVAQGLQRTISHGAIALPKLLCLVQVQLGGNVIGDVGAAWLAKALVVNRTLSLVICGPWGLLGD